MEQHNPAIASPSLLSRYFSFIRDPRSLKTKAGDDELPSASARSSLMREMWRLYAVNVVMLVPAMVLILLVLGGAGPIEDKNALADALQSLSGLKIFLFAVVVAPLLEELMFRLPLQYSPRNLGIPLGILSIYLFNPGMLLRPENVYLSLGINGIFAIALATIFTRLFRRFASTRSRRTWFAKHRRALVYGSAIIFGLIHIFNYDRSLWHLAPILTLPQLILGFALGYVRLSYGFPWAIAFHAGHNFLATAPSIILMSLPADVRTALISGDPPTSLLGLAAGLGLGALMYFCGGLFLIIRSVFYSIREWQRSRR